VEEPAVIDVDFKLWANGHRRWPAYQGWWTAAALFIYILFIFIKRIKIERVFHAKYLVKIFTMCLTAKIKKCTIYLSRSNRVSD
jgi:hypothetical protein